MTRLPRDDAEANFAAMAAARAEVTATFRPMEAWDVGDEFDHRLALTLAQHANPRLLSTAIAECIAGMRRARRLAKR